MMDVVWPKQFKLNRFETGLSASVNGAIGLASFNHARNQLEALSLSF